jgi:parvulin-like peptidyl-prolyl isomerase
MLACLLLAASPLQAKKGEPDTVVIQHILIGYGKSVPDKKLDRKRSEARDLAEELLRRAQEGEDFDAMVKEHTNDAYPGIMLLTNDGVNPVRGGTVRSNVVAKFGDMSFQLEVGEFGLVKHHAALSPYGWHIIKRLE